MEADAKRQMSGLSNALLVYLSDGILGDEQVGAPVDFTKPALFLVQRPILNNLDLIEMRLDELADTGQWPPNTMSQNK